MSTGLDMLSGETQPIFRPYLPKLDLRSLGKKEGLMRMKEAFGWLGASKDLIFILSFE